MNVWRIAWKEIRSDLRDKRSFLFMLAFPIALMLILGTALTNAFENEVKLENVTLLYTDKTTDEQIAANWKGFIEEVQKHGIHFQKVSTGKDGQTRVRADRATGYAELTDRGITYYGSSKQTIESNIVQGMMSVFADKYSLAAAAAKEQPEVIPVLAAHATPSSDFIRETSLIADKSPGSLDYYAVVMSTMIALYAAFSGSALFERERSRRTAIRLSAAPIGQWEIFLGKVIGCTAINVCFVVTVVLFSKYIFKAEWGDHVGIVFFILVTEVLLAVSFGLGLSCLLGVTKANAAVFFFVQIASFLGGAYFPIGEFQGFMAMLTNMSPLRWTNQALMEVIYSSNLQVALPLVAWNIAISAAFLFLAAVILRRREAL
ncbi:ABC transporter permease [Numidum massiliense]|uniref:ABC transporter permease n=1 Tax=Numidum massiliense TaxID=1522315 RepID=UPI0006D58670|nr:ABC transporter permease [Numidum massiliense]